MARIRRWKEKLLIAWFTVFTSVAWARPRSRMLEGRGGAARSLLVTGSGGKRAWGVTLSAASPFVRAFSASAVPVALPVAVGAFAASAGATADLSADAAAAGSICTYCDTAAAPACNQTAAVCCNPYPTSTCHTADGGTCNGGSCRTIICENSLGTYARCLTCGYETCSCY
jgi:hypothetical protein